MYAQRQLGAGRGISALPVLPARIEPPCFRFRRAIHKIKCAAAPAEQITEEEPATSSIQLEMPRESSNKAFPYPLPMEPAQERYAGIPLAVFYPAMLVFVAGAGFVGSVFGRGIPVDPEAKDATSYGVAALAGAGAVYACYQAKKKRDSAAVVDLYNEIVELPEPYDLSAEMMSAVGTKYGIDLHKSELEGLKKIYGQYLESVIPSGETQLKGPEGENVRKFKEALGLSDAEAAPVHIEVAEKLYRQGFESKDRHQQFEQRRAFSRLIYISQLVFGDQQASFLLQWSTHFPVTDAQLFVARRDNAKTIFTALFQNQGWELRADRDFLRHLRERQAAVKMMDESAVEVMRDLQRKHIEGHLGKALEAIRAPGQNKDLSTLVAEVDYVVDYCRKMNEMAGEEDLIPGLGQVSLKGGDLVTDGKIREVKELFKAYLDEKMKQAGQFSEALDQEVQELQLIFNLTPKDAQSMRDEVAAKLYRQLLKEEVSSRRIDAAESPAAVLQDLCEKVRFSPEAALELHRQLYRTKLLGLLPKGHLTKQDQDDLARIRRILCITPDVANKVAKDTCGKQLEEAIAALYEGGIRPLADHEMAKVNKVISDLALDPAVVMEVMTQVTKEQFRSYVKEAQKVKEDRRESAVHMRRLVQFNALVVTPLLEKVKGMDAAMKELAEILKKASEGAEKEAAAEAAAANQDAEKKESTVKLVQKAIQANRGEFGEDEKKGQKEINLKADLDEKVRAEMYRNFLMYIMSGDVVELPVGGMMRKKNNAGSQEANMARLSQLADVLGMDQGEVMRAQQSLAETAYKNQVTDVMQSGPFSQEKAQYLANLQQQLGVSKETADKVMKEVRQEIYGHTAHATPLEEGGRWTLERIEEAFKKGESIEGKVEEVTRRNIFRRELEKRLSDGSGDLDTEYMLTQLPAMLALPDFKTKSIVKELVASRKRMLLVQAVSQYRQKRPAEAVASLQNLLSCLRVLPESEPMPWKEVAELRDVFQAFCSEETSETKRDQLRSVLGLSLDEALELGAESDSEEGRAKALEKATKDTFF